MKPTQYITPDELFSLEARLGQLFKRIKHGNIGIEEALEAVQGILERDYPLPAPYIPPVWYVSPERQLEQVRQLNSERGWGFTESDFPDIPAIQLPGTDILLKQLKRKLKEFGRKLDYDPLRFHDVHGVRLTNEQVLLLGVYLREEGEIGGIQRTFDEHFSVIKESFACREIPFINGSHCGNFPCGIVQSDPDHLRLLDHDHKPGLRWVIYDFSANLRSYAGFSPVDLWQEFVPGLAASEVLSAMMLFPEYMPDSTARLPLMAGYQCLSDSGWIHSPSISRFPVKVRPGAREEVYQTAIVQAGGRHCSWVAPVVRELAT